VLSVTKVLSRLISTIIVLFGISIIAFFLLRIGGGDPARMLLPSTASEVEVEAVREDMGLNEPLTLQYTNYVKGVLKGDLGYSFYFKMDVAELVAKRLPQTAKLAVFGILLAVGFSIPLGVIAATHKGKIVDSIAMFFAIIGQSMSPVWLSCFLILIFGVYLHWLPTQGNTSFANWILPGCALGFDFAATLTRTQRSEMIDVLDQDYITATRARGISNLKVTTKYALKNALLPVVTLIVSSFGALLAGSMVIENIFGWPGMGQLMVTAINARDYQLVQSLLLVTSIILVACNLIADIVYTIIDPRIKFN
jgi:ABC-type dipeptide/oligopeptide/nickel transport system permease component